jgi:molybdopterin-binding protein
VLDVAPGPYDSLAAMGLQTVRTAADRLGVGYSTFKRWIRLGQVRTTQTAGGHHRISDAEIERLLARRPGGSGGRPPVAKATGAIVVISGRNRLRGFVDEIRTEGLMAQVRLRVGDQWLTAVITRDAVEELKLRRGDEAVAIVKSTEVMIAREATLPSAPRRRRPR